MSSSKLNNYKSGSVGARVERSHRSLFSVMPQMMFGLLFLFLLAYVWQINVLATSGYQLKELHGSLSHLRQGRKGLESQLVKFRAIDGLREKVDQLSFYAADKIEYIDPATNIIAKK